MCFGRSSLTILDGCNEPTTARAANRSSRAILGGAMFSQVAIVILAIFLLAMGVREGDFVSVGLGVLIGSFAAHTLYKLKTGS